MKNNKYKKLFIVITATIILISSVSFFYIVKKKYELYINDQKIVECNEFNRICEKIASNMNETITFIYGLRGFVYSQINNSITNSEFDSFSAESQSYSNFVKNFSIAPDNIQKFVFPLEGNEITLGHDLSKDSREMVRKDVHNAEVTKKIIVSGPYKLRQGNLGMVVRNPIFLSDKYWGLVNVVVDIDRLLNNSLASAEYGVTILEISNNDVPFYTIDSPLKKNINYSINVLDGYWVIHGHINEGLTSVNLNNFISSILLNFISIIFISLIVLLIIRRLLNLSNRVNDLTYTDILTSLPNRNSLYLRISFLIENNTEFSLSFIDINNFKDINDSLGHSTGDMILIEISKRIKSNTYETYRWGGDEFIILKKNISKEDMKLVINKIVDKIHTPMYIAKEVFQLTSSAGVVNYPEDGITNDEILKLADASMYMAKLKGINNTVLYSDEIGETLKTEYSIERKLTKAVHNNELEVHYQPQISLLDKSVIGLEALVRWRDDDGLYISPEIFIPIAESSHLIEKIDNFVMKEAILKLYLLQKEGYNIKMSVNISPRHFNDELVNNIKLLKTKYDLAAGKIEIEITENAFIDNFENSRKHIKNLHEYGIDIALDDFGKGYSSLTYLSELDIDTLKIDKSFVSKLDTKDTEYVIVKSIIDITKSLNIHTIAEGVESQNQIDILKDLHCSTIQGFLIKRPSSFEEIKSWIKKQV